MKYIITGGAGFIGSHIAKELALRGEEVVVVDNLFTGKISNLAYFKLTFIEADIRDLKTLIGIFKGADYVLHQAALRSVPKSLENPQDYHDVNINGHLNVLMAAKLNRVKCVVSASSSSVLGDITKLPIKEDSYPNPISPYAISKLAGEQYNKMYSKIYGLNTVSLRYFNVFGPNQAIDSKYAVVIPKFIQCILNSESPPVFGDGLQTRDFTYVSNVVEANLLACKKELHGEVINIANGQRITILQLIEKINERLHKNIKPRFLHKRLGDILHTQADNTRAKELLGYQERDNFDEGLNKTIDWFKDNLA